MGEPLVEDVDGIRWITLNRPEILNATTLDDLRVITKAVNDADASVRGIVLTGAGDRAFSAGMHTDTFHKLDRQQAFDAISVVAECLTAVRTSPKPVVARINGYCMGAAFEMIMSADIRVAHEGVLFGLPEVKLGIPSIADASLLQEYVGLGFAKEFILTGDNYPATQAPLSGIVNSFVAPEDLTTETMRFMDKLAGHTPVVVAAQKDLIETWLNTPLKVGIERSRDVFADVFVDPATAQAVSDYRDRLKK